MRLPNLFLFFNHKTEMQMIILNDGTQVPIAAIIRHMALSGVTTMAITQRHVAFLDHPDHESLDFMLRCHSDNMDTAQATAMVVEQVTTSGYFEPAMVPSNNTGSDQMVKGIQLI